MPPDQWPFQEPKLEVPTTYTAYARAMQGYMIHTPKISQNIVQYLHFRILGSPVDSRVDGGKLVDMGTLGTDLKQIGDDTDAVVRTP